MTTLTEFSLVWRSPESVAREAKQHVEVAGIIASGAVSQAHEVSHQRWAIDAIAWHLQCTLVRLAYLDRLTIT